MTLPRFARNFSGFLTMAMAAALSMAATPATAQTVTTPGGIFPSETYQGLTADGVAEFLGIRYAAAPTGDLRFAAPTPPAAVSGTIDAEEFGSSCPQNASPFGTASSDEDCLFLNIFVPHAPVSAKSHFPVMLFIHGGAFVDGEGSDYLGAELATQGDVIVVTINYRLGILGFLADAALDAESSTGSSGNYGISDQQFALKWVAQNISAFGGNPENVTIFGESAGAFSVCTNLVSPGAAGLFGRAIMESGPCATALPPKAVAETGGAEIAAGLGCTGSNSAIVACLRAQPVANILAVENAITSQGTLASLTSFFPDVDGVIIPQEPLDALALGEFNHVPVIIGTNHDEGRLFIALAYDLNPLAGPLTAAEYPAAVESIAAAAVAEGEELGGGSGNPGLVEQITTEIENEYPLSNYPSPDLALAAIFTDSAFSCPADSTRDLTSLQVPTFGYEFNDENAPMDFLPPVTFPYGATHTDELQFLFPFPATLTSKEQRLAATMKDYWANFAANGYPSKFGHPLWPPFSILLGDDQSLVPPTPTTEFNFFNSHKCAFWLEVLLQTAVEGVPDKFRTLGIIH
jgi:para-nitrobenzyl esterase